MIGTSQTVEIALVAGVPKVVLQLRAGTGTHVKILRWSVSFDGNNSAGKPILIELEREDNAGSTITAPNPENADDSIIETFKSTVGHNWTSTPGATAVLESLRCKAQGRITVVYPYGQEIEIRQQKKVGIRVTSPLAINCRASITFEE